VVPPTDSRSVCLRIKHPSGAYDQIFITGRQLRVCRCGALSVTRGRSVVSNCCWPSPEQPFSGPIPVGLVTIFYCLKFDTHPTGGPGSRIYISQEPVAQLYPQALGSLFVASYDSQGLGGRIRTRLHAKRELVKSK
jgi:hypothetical protein